MSQNSKSGRDQVLPLRICLTYLGDFWAIALCAFILFKKFPSSYLLVSVISFLFIVVVLLSYIVLGHGNYKRIIKQESYAFNHSCLDCIRNRMEDDFHKHGLVHLNDLLQIEQKLSESSDPRQCKVLVYTSDLATENDAEEVVNINIEHGVQYIVLYFANSCTPEQNDRIKRLYGEQNLIDLSKKRKNKQSFDGRLAETLGFDITIYNNVDIKNKLSGFFAVDFVPKNRRVRIFHNPNCTEPCNYGRETEAFYKKMSYESTKRLYEEGLSIQQDLGK